MRMKPIAERSAAWRRPSAAEVACWLIPFALVVYLGMRRGGYEEPVRGSVGVAIWWFVALGTLVYALPRSRIGRWGWVGLGLLTAFAAWTAIGVSWSSSSGRSVTEVARVVTYVGVFALALLIGGRERLRTVIGAVGTGCAAIAVIALLSRLHPSWFPADTISEQVVGVQGRLRYPVLYWNALAGLVAIGVPLIVWAATSARSYVLRGLSAALVPSMALTIYFTYSRTGAVTAGIAVLVYLALSRRRLALLAPIAAIAAISAVVVWQASRRQALVDALGDSTATSQGAEMLVIVAVASAIVGVVVWALAQAEGWRLLPPAPEIGRRTAARIALATLLVAVVAFIGLGGPGRVSTAFNDFKQPTALSDSSDRLTSVAGNGRWQYWSSAVDAWQTAPVEGIGPGTFQFWWLEHRTNYNQARDAHSLFVETLGELGIVGLALIASFCLLVLVAGTRRALRAAGERRGQLAALTAAAVAFVIGAGVDWLWELAVLPVAFLFVAAAILGTRSDDDRDPDIGGGEAASGTDPAAAGRLRRWREPGARLAGALLALGAAAVIAVPALAAQDLADSREAFDSGELSTALAEARSAADLEPYAADPRMQEAFVLEEDEQFAKAVGAAREATEREATNWETWYLLSRTQAERGGKTGAALKALHRAQELNPNNALTNPFNCGPDGSRCVSAPAP
jgi:tetratricopeptide (TPR) repeat protein